MYNSVEVYPVDTYYNGSNIVDYPVTRVTRRRDGRTVSSNLMRGSTSDMFRRFVDRFGYTLVDVTNDGWYTFECDR